MAQKRERIAPYLVCLVDYTKPRAPKIVAIDGQQIFLVPVPDGTEDIDTYVGLQAGAICSKAKIDPAKVEPYIYPFASTR